MSSTGVVLGFGISVLVFCLGLVAARILFAMAVYNDAIAKGNDSSVMWAVLVGFFGLIPGIVYLCTRNSTANRIIVCPNCGWGNPMSAPSCGRCNTPNPYAQNFNRPDAALRTHRAKVLLIWGIVVDVAVIVIWVIMFAAFMFSAAKYGGSVHYSYTY